MNRVKDFYKKISEQIVLFAIIIVIIIAMGIASPYFLSVRNAMNIVQYVSTYGIIAIGMTMVILTGGINLSVGGTLALSVYVAAKCMLSGIPWPIAIFACLLVGGLVGIVNGFAVAGLKIPPLIATLAVEQITRGVHLGLAQGAPLHGYLWQSSGLWDYSCFSDSSLQRQRPEGLYMQWAATRRQPGLRVSTIRG